MAKTYQMTIAGCKRDLPLCEVDEHLDIAAFIMFGDVEITYKNKQCRKRSKARGRITGFNLTYSRGV